MGLGSWREVKEGGAVCILIQFSSVQSLSHVQLFATPWTAACQASLSIINYRSLLKLMSIESVMPSNHLILCQAEVEAEVALVSCPEGHVYGKVAQGL